MGKRKKEFEQRRQKKIARSKVRRKKKLLIRGASVSLKSPSFSQTEYSWWLAHGLNYLNSDYASGTWDPICDIYEGQTPPPPPELLHSVITKHKIDPENATKQENFLCAWCLGVSNEALYGIIFGLTKMLTKENPEMDLKDMRQPHNGKVWEFFDEYVKSKVLG